MKANITITKCDDGKCDIEMGGYAEDLLEMMVTVIAQIYRAGDQAKIAEASDNEIFKAVAKHAQKQFRLKKINEMLDELEKDGAPNEDARWGELSKELLAMVNEQIGASI